MQYRPLGRTGVNVSTLGLGTMVLGAWGNTDCNQRGNSRRWILRRSRTACAVSTPTASTCTRCTARTR